MDVDPRERYVETHLSVHPGERYRFSATGKWKDGFMSPCGPEGWGGGALTRFARVKGQPFFRLCASIGKDDHTAFAVDTTQPWTVPDITPPNGDRQLYLFANDLWLMYWNNRALTEEEGGPLRVTITRLT